MNSSSQRLPTAGETVLINGLLSTPALNGKRGKIARYIKEKHRYSVKLCGSQKKKTLAVKPQNISILPSKKKDHAGSIIRGNDAFYYCGDWDVTHVLVPCHVENRRRYEQFRQCVRSLVHQIGRCRILVSVSGPAELRQLAIGTLRGAAAIPEHDVGRQHQWIVLEEDADSEYTRKAQFQHYKSLLEVSAMIKPSAWLMFLDNDDLYHKFRVRWFQDIIAKRGTEENEIENAFYCGSKLLIDVVKANEKFGTGDHDVIQYDQFVTLDDELTGIVYVACSAQENDKLDVQEYFDFCVKTEVFQQFMDATPDGILSNQFCDVRFAGSLSHHKIRTYEHPEQEWLLMHYRVRLSDRHKSFLELDTNTFTNAMVKIDVSEEDRHLEELTGLKAAKIAFLRRDIEEAAIQAVHRDEANVLYFWNQRVPYMDKTYGHKIGTLLWKEVMAKLESCYTEEQAKKSRDWWIKCCKIRPPPAWGNIDVIHILRSSTIIIMIIIIILYRNSRNQQPPTIECGMDGIIAQCQWDGVSTGTYSSIIIIVIAVIIGGSICICVGDKEKYF